MFALIVVTLFSYSLSWLLVLALVGAVIVPRHFILAYALVCSLFWAIFSGFTNGSHYGGGVGGAVLIGAAGLTSSLIYIILFARGMRSWLNRETVAEQQGKPAPSGADAQQLVWAELMGASISVYFLLIGWHPGGFQSYENVAHLKLVLVPPLLAVLFIPLSPYLIPTVPDKLIRRHLWLGCLVGTALGVAASVAFINGRIESVENVAESMAKDRPYCIQVAQRSFYEAARTELDLSPLVMRGGGREGYSWRFSNHHAVLQIQNSDGIESYYWSYFQNQFVDKEGVRGDGRRLLCEPKKHFINSLDSVETSLRQISLF